MVVLARRSAFALSMTAAVWLAGLAAAQPATAQDVLLHRQLPNRLGGALSDTQALFSGPNGPVSGQLAADRFRLSQADVIRKLVVWSFFGGQTEQFDPPPPVTETMRVRFYADAGGLPGGLLYEEEFLNPPRVFTGFTVSGDPRRKEYRYDVTLSAGFPVAANTDFWLELAQLGDPNSVFRWEFSSGGEIGIQLLLDTPWRVFQGVQLAYELRTPEPSGVALFLMFAGLMRLRRVRSRRSR